jgi:hypothetical protein
MSTKRPREALQAEPTQTQPQTPMQTPPQISSLLYSEIVNSYSYKYPCEFDKPRVHLKSCPYFVGVCAPPSLGVYTVILDGVKVGQSDQYGRFLIRDTDVNLTQVPKLSARASDYVIAYMIEIEYCDTAHFNKMIALAKSAYAMGGHVLDQALCVTIMPDSRHKMLDATITVLSRNLIVSEQPTNSPVVQHAKQNIYAPTGLRFTA